MHLFCPPGCCSDHPCMYIQLLTGKVPSTPETLLTHILWYENIFTFPSCWTPVVELPIDFTCHVHAHDRYSHFLVAELRIMQTDQLIIINFLYIYNACGKIFTFPCIWTTVHILYMYMYMYVHSCTYVYSTFIFPCLWTLNCADWAAYNIHVSNNHFSKST